MKLKLWMITAALVALPQALCLAGANKTGGNNEVLMDTTNAREARRTAERKNEEYR